MVLLPYCGMKRSVVFPALGWLLWNSFLSQGQSTLLPLNDDIYHWITRAEIKTQALNGKFHSAVKGYQRKDLVELMDSNLAQNPALSRVDRFHIQYFRETSSEFAQPDSSGLRPPLWNAFFRRKSDILSYEDKNFDVHANIVGYGSLGKASDNNSQPYINTRGIEVRGMIAKRVGFYTFMAENQMITPGYVNDWVNGTNSVPHEGFWKRYKTNGYDFFTARGYVTFSATKFIDFQVGNDRFHIGNGYRSLILSDFATGYNFAKINTKVWKLQYTNLFVNLKTNISLGPGGTPGNKIIPDKYFFFHRLGINLGKKVNVGVFEAVVAGRDPQIHPNANKLDLAYLNPIIFYRSVEQNSGSPDNAGLGIDAKVIPIKNVMLYGQISLDEFVLAEMKAQNGWWANKYAYQIGGQYIDVGGLKNVDLQLEYNFVRPFTYSHLSPYTSYTHFSQPLAHPLGSNFREFIAILRVQPIPTVTATFKAITWVKGVDKDSVNYGGNIFRSYFDNRVKNYGNDLGQGVKQEILYLDATVSWQFWTNFFLDFKQVIRTNRGQKLPGEQNTTFTSMAIRWNIAQRLHEF